MLKLGFFSDTHLNENILFPHEIDVFFHCGDLLNTGSFKELSMILPIFEKGLRGRPLFFTPGNHDNVFDSPRATEAIRLLQDLNIHVMIDKETILNCKGETIRCWFMPWVPPTLPEHCFNIDDSLRKKFIDLIPSNLDILITHGPPHLILDTGHVLSHHFGDKLLAEKTSTMGKSLKVHAFGHIHEGRGIRRNPDGLLSLNAAVGDEGLALPIIIDYPGLNVLSPFPV